jgi:trk system potassium uptake protein TrkH
MRKMRLGIKPINVLPLGFIAVILTGTMILMLPISSKDGSSLSLVNALFTATSASCVTGLVVVDTGTYFSLFGQLVILLLIQLGGLGIMTMSMILFGLTDGRFLCTTA